MAAKWLSVLGKIGMEAGTLLIPGAGGLLSTILTTTGGTLTAVPTTVAAAPAAPAASDLDMVETVVKNIELAAQGATAPIPGTEKLKLATPLAVQFFLLWMHQRGYEIDDPVLFTQGATKVVDGVADMVNSRKASSIKSVKLA